MPVSRALHGIVLATLATVLAATAHVAGGGALPDIGVLLVLLPLLAVAVLGLGGRGAGPVTTLVALAAGQAGLHVLLSVLHHHPSVIVAGGAPMLGLHLLATVATALLLHHAERGLALVARALCRVLPGRPPVPVIDRPLPARPAPAAGTSARATLILLVAHARRGPPVGC